MKIENTGSMPVTPKRTEGVQSSSKKTPVQGTRPTGEAKDRAEVTESARLLAKARAALDKVNPDNAGDVESERVEILKQQIENGNYQIPVEELAKRLLSRRNFE